MMSEKGPDVLDTSTSGTRLANFQGYINKIFAEKLNIFVVIYLNDILIYSNNPSQLYMEVV